MRFLRGGSVEDLLAAGPIDLHRVVSITEQIASALAAAHRQGVVHRDVKPGNLLLDEEGNAYLTDFGVALDAGSPERSTGTMMRGTPAYLSPEQIRLEPASPRSDIYAFGIVAFEMLTGTASVPRDVAHGTARSPPARRDPLRSRCSSRASPRPRRRDRQSHRERSSRSLRQRSRLRRRVPCRARRDVPRRRTPVGAARNPYKGLRSFLEPDAADYFGREAVTNRLIRSLSEEGPSGRFLAVVGPSGSGKSSVVRAGLVPALRQGALPGSHRWYVIDMLPGSHPLREIETALLGVAVEPPPSLMEELERDDLGLARAVDRVLPDAEAELVIVLDQLEEVFTTGGGRGRTNALPSRPPRGGASAGGQGPRRRDPACRLLRCAAIGPCLRRAPRRANRGDHADVAGGTRASHRRSGRSGRVRRGAATGRRDDRRCRRSPGRAPLAAVRAHRARGAAPRTACSRSTRTGGSTECPARSPVAPSSCSSRCTERGATRAASCSFD